jgi:protein-S-isoprenylcysteine O-methyltransferase Ste14
MPDLATSVVLLVWTVFGAVWFALARDVKSSQRVESPLSRVAHLLPLAVACVLLFQPMPAPLRLLDQRFVESSATVFALGALVAATGIGFAIWARLTLGRNWSASVTQKTDHELIVGGPFRYVRHPIYTGMITGMLGSALVIGEWRAVLALVITFAALWRKYRLEERFMLELFGTRYLEYRRHVPALIPVFVRHA